MKQYDFAVYIGRFQPFHLGHLHALNTAREYAKHVIVLVGSSNIAISPKNPWTFHERKLMIENVVQDDILAGGWDKGKVHINPLNDYPYDDQNWVLSVQQRVAGIIESIKPKQTSDSPEPSVVLIGHEKDQSTYYLKLFPQWEYMDTGNVEGHLKFDATTIRKMMFEDNLHYIQAALPFSVNSFLNSWCSSHSYKALRAEYDQIQEYKKSWAGAPYPPIFVTTDAVVIQSGHVLVVQRKHAPGAGLYALPGGFLNQNELLEEGMLRELREETNIKLQNQVLRRCIKHKEVFDHPDRSLRGRTITHAFLIRLDDSQPLPKVKGGDDANRAIWMPFDQVSENHQKFFEDHVHIIKHMINKS